MPYQFKLEKYRGLKTRHTCPACGMKKSFVRYVNDDDGNYIADHVGRCNREVNCGYHYKPGQYFKDNDIHISQPEIPQKRKTSLPIKTSYIPEELFKKSLSNYNKNHFIHFLNSKFGNEQVKQALDKYHVGTSKHWTGATVFWQIDIDGKIRTGKVMLYDPITGKRVKKPHNHISWAHSLLKLEHFNLRQCLFGEHLLVASNNPVCIVESEKTALVACLYLPEYIWLSTGGLQNLKPELFTKLKSRQVILYPDLGAYDLWNKKARMLKNENFNVVTSNLLEDNALEEEKEKGYDIADYLIDFSRKNQRCNIISDETLIEFAKHQIKPGNSYSDCEIERKLKEQFPDCKTKMLFRKLVEKELLSPSLPFEKQFHLCGSTPF